MGKFAKGDKVKVVYLEREGVIDSVHGNIAPYRVKIDYGVYEWCKEEELEHV